MFGQLVVLQAMMELLMRRHQMSPIEFPENAGSGGNKRPMSFPKQLWGMRPSCR